MESDNILEKGITLMKDALNKYESGDYDSADISRNQANDYFDRLYTMRTTNEGKNDLRYNSSRNFGIIYNVIEENAGKLFRSKDGKEKLGRLIKEIKSNKILKEQFSYYNAISNPINISDTEKYSNEILSIAPHFTLKELKENNNKLLKLVQKYNLNEDVYIDSEKIKLYEAIEWTIINKKSALNLNEYIEHRNFINKNISENNKLITEKVDYFEELNTLSKKYENELNEDEKQLIDKIANPNVNKNELFEEYRNETLKSIDEVIAENSDENLDTYNKWKKTINEKVYNEKTLLSDITDMINIKNILDE